LVTKLEAVADIAKEAQGSEARLRRESQHIWSHVLNEDLKKQIKEEYTTYVENYKAANTNTSQLNAEATGSQ
jgi:hypothetical protein